jgi:ectoine hydroxylase-related dioxygenase (phytanoyl-CoA dioxygenase family)
MTTTPAGLTQEQLSLYEQDGFLFFDGFLDACDLGDVHHDIASLTRGRHESTVLESESQNIRALHGSHLVSRACDLLSRHEKLLASARSILNNDVYLYQFKINMKAPFVGEVWPWHQDYIYWRNEDGMPAPNAVNVVVFLDEVTEFNGPINLIAKSHVGGVIEPVAYRSSGMRPDADDWKENVSADLRYQIANETVFDLAEAGGLVAPKGPVGSVLFFHSNLVHGSAPNVSPYARRIAILTYNSVSNAPKSEDLHRPEFLVSRVAVPL